MQKIILKLLVILLISFSCEEKESYQLVISDVNFFDGEKNHGIVNIGINADTIAVISKDLIASDSIIDGTGKFLMPGMVDGHVHVNSLDQLKSSYQLGILALMNMHTGLEDREREWKQLSRDSTEYAYLFGAGHAATIPNTHPTQYSPDMETINDTMAIDNWLDNRMSKQVDYIKIVRNGEHGWMNIPPGSSLTDTQIKSIIDQSHKKGYKAVVHSGTVEGHMALAKMNADGLVHLLSYKKDWPIPDSYYTTLAENDIFVVPTSGMFLRPTDGLPPDFQKWLSENLLSAEQQADIIKKLHDAGVLIVAGTDAQQGQMNFEGDYFLELEVYEMAGLSNLEVLKTATGNAAKAFDIPIGKLEVGCKLNMLLINGNPLEDLEALKSIEKIWKTFL